MKALPATPELLAVAERVVWFKAPSEALAEPTHFLAHVMTYGTVEDLCALEGFVGEREFKEYLKTRRLGSSIRVPGPTGI